jgi:hypothetical protein
MQPGNFTAPYVPQLFSEDAGGAVVGIWLSVGSQTYEVHLCSKITTNSTANT